MTKTVVVLGGAYAGLQIAHRLLKYTLPQEKDLKVILVSKSSYFYWNLAAVRGIIPGVLQDEQLFQPIEPGFASYPEGSFEFVTGTATALDAAAKSVTVDVDGAEEARSLSYDFLVVTTGTRSVSTDMPWKNGGTYEDDRKALHAIADRVKAARSIVVAGAGATGIETAAELGFEFGKDKEITLVSSGKEVLDGDAIASRAENELTKLGVKIVKETKVTGATNAAEGKTELALSTGDTMLVDLYLPTIGMVPNSDFIDESLLTEHKYLDVNEFFQVKGHDNIWGSGDIVSIPKGSYAVTEQQTASVYKNVHAAITGGKQAVVKGLPIDVLVCSTGRSRGAGRLGVVKIPSIAVWGIKGRTLGVQSLPKYVNGAQW